MLFSTPNIIREFQVNINHICLFIVFIYMLFTAFYLIKASINSSFKLYLRSYVTLALTACISLWSYEQMPDLAGYISAVCYGYLLLLPLILNKAFWYLSLKQYDKLARTVLMINSLLTLDFSERPKILALLTDKSEQSKEKIRHYISTFDESSSVIPLEYIPQLYLVGGQYKELKDWFASLSPEVLEQNKLAFFLPQLRVLGETGDLNGMLNFLHANQKVFSLFKPSTTASSFVYLYLYAFCGCTDSLENLFDTSLKVLTDVKKKLWLTIALCANGDYEKMDALLDSIQTDDLETLNAIERRRNRVYAHAQSTLTDDSKAQLQQFQNEMRVSNTLLPKAANKKISIMPIHALAAICVMVFLGEITMGLRYATLYKLGGLLPYFMSWSTDWWHLLAYNFVHVNWVHLLMNLVGLYIIAPYVKDKLNTVKFFTCFLLSGVISGISAYFVDNYYLIQATLHVGASSCVMGLVGAALRLLLNERAMNSKSHTIHYLKNIILVIAAQILFDATTPNIDSVGHYTGLLSGFFITWLLTWQTNEETNGVKS